MHNTTSAPSAEMFFALAAPPAAEVPDLVDPLVCAHPDSAAVLDADGERVLSCDECGATVGQIRAMAGV